MKTNMLVSAAVIAAIKPVESGTNSTACPCRRLGLVVQWHCRGSKQAHFSYDSYQLFWMPGNVGRTGTKPRSRQRQRFRSRHFGISLTRGWQGWCRLSQRR